jgi:chromosome segregation ATPase
MGQRLLLVDNDRRFIKDHQVALEAAFDIDYLNSTEAVVSRLEGGDYAAALLCVEVSENKGYALCSAIRKNPKLADMKVILISAKATEEEYARHRSLKGKADLYLHKPIISGSLVASLSSLVPPKAMDPDNPLGDLSGADLGDEWLESLKTDLDPEEKPKAAPASNVTTAPVGIPIPTLPTVPTMPVPQIAPPALPSVKTIPTAPSLATVAIQVPGKLQAAPSADAGKIALLEARVKDLEYKLQSANDSLAAKAGELDSLRHEHESATRNLEANSGQSAEKIASLTAQLEEVEGDHQRLRVTVEDLGRQLTEKEQEAAELQQIKRDQEWKIGELQGLEGRVNELQAELEPLRGAEQARQELERRVSELQAQAGAASEAQNQLSELRQELERREAEQQQLQQRLETEKQELQNRAEAERQELQNRLEGEKQDLQRRLEAEKQELQDRLNGEIQGLQDRLESEKRALLENLEGEKKSLQEQIEAQAKELAEVHAEAEAARVDVGGLEATLRAQRRELANLENRLGTLTKENQSQKEQIEGHESEMEHLTSTVRDRDQALQERDRQLSDLKSSEEKARNRNGELEKEVDQLKTQHERQQMELLRGLDEKETVIGRLNATLESQRERIGTLEHEKQKLEGNLNEQTARLEALTGAISDLENNIRRASDLTRPV